MKIFIKIVSSILLIPLLLISIIFGFIKFQILNDQFWFETLDRHKVYDGMQVELNNYLNSKNANIFSSILTVENIKDATNKNIVNVLKFANGQDSELKFYIPITKIPKEMLPKKLGSIKESMTVKEIIQKFNIGGIDAALFDQFKYAGKITNYIFYTSLTLAIVVGVLSFPLTIGIIGVFLLSIQFLTPFINLNGNRLYVLFLDSLITELSKKAGIIGIILIIISIVFMLLKKYIANKKHG